MSSDDEYFTANEDDDDMHDVYVLWTSDDGTQWILPRCTYDPFSTHPQSQIIRVDDLASRLARSHIKESRPARAATSDAHDERHKAGGEQAAYILHDDKGVAREGEHEGSR